MLTARGQRHAAVAMLQSAWLLVSGFSIVILGLISLIVFSSPVANWLGLSVFSNARATGILTLLALHLGLVGEVEILHAVLRANGRFALRPICQSVIQLGEFGTLVVVVAVGGTPGWVVVAVVGTQVLGMVGMRILIGRTCSWMRFGIRHARHTIMRSLIRSGLLGVGFPLGNILRIQGPILIAGVILGPFSIVILVTHRTISKVALQMTSVFINAVMPELVVAFGPGKIGSATRLHRQTVSFSLIASLDIIALLIPLDDVVLEVWTSDEIPFDGTLLIILLLVAVANAF